LQQAKQCHKACIDPKKKQKTTTKIEEWKNYVWRGTNFLKENNDCYT
jgi:hypothetical protein